MLRRLRRAAALALLAHAGLLGTRAWRLECDVPCAPGGATYAGEGTASPHAAMPDDAGMPPSHHARGGAPSPAPHHGNASDSCDLTAGCVAPFIARAAGDVAAPATRASAPRARAVLFPASVTADPDSPPPRA